MERNENDEIALLSEDVATPKAPEGDRKFASATNYAIVEPEGLVPDLELSQHTEGSWPSSQNVSQ